MKVPSLERCSGPKFYNFVLVLLTLLLCLLFGRQSFCPCPSGGGADRSEMRSAGNLVKMAASPCLCPDYAVLNSSNSNFSFCMVASFLLQICQYQYNYIQYHIQLQCSVWVYINYPITPDIRNITKNMHMEPWDEYSTQISYSNIRVRRENPSTRWQIFYSNICPNIPQIATRIFTRISWGGYSSKNSTRNSRMEHGC